MLDDARIDFTRSRPRRCNDNALVEAKNGVVVRRQFGYSYVPAERAEQFNALWSRSTREWKAAMNRDTKTGSRSHGRNGENRQADVQPPVRQKDGHASAGRRMR